MKWTLAILALVSVAGCEFSGHGFGPQTMGSGKMKTETRKVASFDAIVSKGSPDIDVEIGKETSLEVTADDNIVPLITTEVKDGTLTVSSSGSYSTRKGVHIKIVVPALKELEIDGSGDAKVAGLENKEFTASVSGSGDITSSGITEKLEVSCDGSGDLDLSTLKAKSAKASVNGSGNIELSVSDELDANINGSGDISYTGKPKVTKNVQGSGDIHEKD